MNKEEEDSWEKEKETIMKEEIDPCLWLILMSIRLRYSSHNLEDAVWLKFQNDEKEKSHQPKQDLTLCIYTAQEAFLSPVEKKTQYVNHVLLSYHYKYG